MPSTFVEPATLGQPPALTAPLPPPRGPVTEQLLAALAGPAAVPELAAAAATVDATDDEDRQLALYCCYELHYGGFIGVDPSWEWAPSLLTLRAELERHFEAQLHAWVAEAYGDRPSPGRAGDSGGDGPADAGLDPGVVGMRGSTGRDGRATGVDQPVAAVVAGLWRLARGGGGPSLSAWLAQHGALGHARELAVHRSVYQLKEADPHTWAVPRLGGRAKATLVAIQFGEYGDGVADEMHASLFAETMVALGLDPTPNAYLDRVPAHTLASTNLISLLGLHRRWRGALVGHLALFEMTSTGPMQRYADALERLGLAPRARRFYDVHVAADAVHERLAADEMVPGLLEREPGLAADVLFGARALQVVEARAATRTIASWEAGTSSLRGQVPSSGRMGGPSGG